MRESFWQNNSLVAHILYELQPIIIFSPVANFGDQSLYFFLCIQNCCSYCISLRKCVRLDLQTASLGLVKTCQGFGFLTLEIFSLSSTSQDNCGESSRAVPSCTECQKIFFCSQNRRTCIKHKENAWNLSSIIFLIDVFGFLLFIHNLS